MHRHHIHILSFILMAFAFILHLPSLEAGEMEDALKKLQKVQLISYLECLLISLNVVKRLVQCYLIHGLGSN